MASTKAPHVIPRPHILTVTLDDGREVRLDEKRSADEVRDFCHTLAHDGLRWGAEWYPPHRVAHVTVGTTP